MSYIKVSIALFLLSLGLFLLGFTPEEIEYGLIIAGMIFNYIGIAMLLTGAIKRYKSAD
ncbi:protein of unknown function [Salimicrobium album]|uniref:Uncharacterized protein n=1 Tax=Salimicrobium album TaxID=50717 RepID=A0A1H3INT7_9BACI|nr:protein of unknown function [Salimicrobium album]